jgi:hypothetical protein
VSVLSRIVGGMHGTCTKAKMGIRRGKNTYEKNNP